MSKSKTAPSIAFFGQGPLASSVLESIVDSGFEVSLVNDSEGTSGTLSNAALSLGIPVKSLHPRKELDALTDSFHDTNTSDGVLLSVNYRYIIDQRILNMFAWPLNIHGSLLPKYRGRTPHVWAIINGETETGITIHVMDEGVDTGPILVQESVPIEAEMTGAMLLERFEQQYPDLVVRALSAISAKIEPEPQPHESATYFGKRTPEMGLIDFRLPFRHLKNFIRAIAPPYPGAYCHLADGTRVIVSDVRHLHNEESSGALPKYSPRKHNGRIFVRTDDGVVECVQANQLGGQA